MRLVLVRHGQTASNLAHALDTEEPGAELTEQGERQAEGAANRLASLPIEAIFASNLARTQQTAAPLAARLSLPVTVHAGLREARAGELEMRTDKESVRTYLKTYLAWVNGRIDERRPGGESGREVITRFDRALAQLEATGVLMAAVFSHGATIRAWCASRVRNLDADFVARHPLDNCGAVFLKRPGDESGWLAEAWEHDALGGFDLDLPLDPAAPTPSGQ